MSKGQNLIVPEPVGETRRLARFIREEGLSEQTILTAVDLIQQRTDVFLRDALAVSEQEAGFRSACKAGCGYCCHTLVSVAPPEAFHIARHIERTMEGAARETLQREVRAYAGRTKGMDGGARYEAREPCPFLRPDDWYCGLHTARPLVCRAMHSGSLAACISAYRNRDATVPAPTMAYFFRNTDAYMSAYVSALKPYGIACYPVELASALTLIWDGENVFGRWLGGEDVFADAAVARTVARPQARKRA